MEWTIIWIWTNANFYVCFFQNTIVPIEAGENDDDADVIAESVYVDQYFEQDQNDVNVVAVRKLQKIYKKKKKKQTKVAVKNVSFGIPKGQVFGLLGEK